MTSSTTFAGYQLHGQMSRRARAYMLVAFIRHTLLGVACILAPHGFNSVTYDGVKGLLPLPADTAIAGWGGLFLATGLFCAVSAWLGREGEARWALLASVLTTALWASGFAVFIVSLWVSSGELVNPSGPIVWTALCLKDLTMLRSPLRTPLEDFLRQVGEAEVPADGR